MIGRDEFHSNSKYANPHHSRLPGTTYLQRSGLVVPLACHRRQLAPEDLPLVHIKASNPSPQSRAALRTARQPFSRRIQDHR